METRIEEHKRALRLKQQNKSAIADHCLEENHDIGESVVLKEVGNKFHLDAWESIYMSKGEELLNVEEAPISSKLFDFVSVRKCDKLQREN